jgi:putative transposase
MSRKTPAGEATVVQVCEALLLSRSAYYAALGRDGEATTPSPSVEATSVPSLTSPAACAGSVDATKREARSSRSTPLVSDEALRSAIEAVSMAQPAWGSRKVYHALRRAPYAFRTSRKRVVRWMRELGLLFPAHEARVTALFGHVTVPEANRRWAIDLTTTFTCDAGWVAVVPVVDCGCRSVLAIEVTRSQDSLHVLAPLKRALEREFGDVTGVPQDLELRSDNGPQFTGYDCEQLCKSWDLEQTFSPPGRPTGNSVVERLIRTMKEECIWQRDWESIDQLRAALDAWVEAYDTQRPHQALGWATPAERRAELTQAALRAA